MRQLELGPAEFERDEAARGLVEDFNAGDTPKLKIIHSPEPMHDATHDLSSNALACGVLFDTPSVDDCSNRRGLGHVCRYQYIGFRREIKPDTFDGRSLTCKRILGRKQTGLMLLVLGKQRRYIKFAH